MPSRDDRLTRHIEKSVPPIPNDPAADAFKAYAHAQSLRRRDDEDEERVPGWAVWLMEEMARNSEWCKNTDLKTSRLCTSVHGDGVDKPGLVLEMKGLKADIKKINDRHDTIAGLPSQAFKTAAAACITAIMSIATAAFVAKAVAKPDAPKVENHTTIEAARP